VVRGSGNLVFGERIILLSAFGFWFSIILFSVLKEIAQHGHDFIKDHEATIFCGKIRVVPSHWHAILAGNLQSMLSVSAE